MSTTTTAIDIVKTLLSNPTDDDNLAQTVSPTATYTSLCYSNPALKKLMPYAGVAEKGGPDAVKFTFTTVRTIWQTESFSILSIFSDEASHTHSHSQSHSPTHTPSSSSPSPFAEPVNVAVFGKFRYSSTVLGKRYTSPFSFWCKVDMNTKLVVEMQFMEDTFGTSAVFEKSGEKTYEVSPGEEITIKTAPEDVNEG